MLKGAKRLADSQVAQWHGDPNEEPAFFEPFKIAVEKKVAREKTAHALAGLFHLIVISGILVVTHFSGHGLLQALKVVAAWFLVILLKTLWSIRNWFKAVKAENQFVKTKDKGKILEEEEEKQDGEL